MARLRISTPSVAPRDSSRLASAAASSLPPHASSHRHSPAFDQENNTSATNPRTKHARKTSSVTPNHLASPRAAKRRTLAERSTTGRRRDASEEEDEDAQDAPLRAVGDDDNDDDGSDNDLYNPHQSLEERQRLRRQMRELGTEALDNQQEWLAGDGIRNGLQRANMLFQKVKQTSDAIIDSRFLVTIGDIAYKKTTQLIMGDGSQGIDVDEFVGKCITFMKDSSGEPSQHDDSDDEDDDGDALNWEALGMDATFIHNSRPPLPSFLLGPLSLQKRIKAPRQRTARNARSQQAPETRPTEMSRDDLQTGDDNGLAARCQEMHTQIVRTYDDIAAISEAFYLHRESDGIAPINNDELAQFLRIEGSSDAALEKYLASGGIGDNGELLLFHCVINPGSFSQTVENMFYLSFLVRDGLVGIDFDSRGLPTITNRQETDPEERARQAARAQRHQAIFSIDHDLFEEIKELLGMGPEHESWFADRTAQDEERAAREGVGNGWYR